jgi:hypothetical protein
MVCEKCQTKLSNIVTPDTWKEGSRNTTESGGRVLNENKAATSKKSTSYSPYTTSFKKVRYNSDMRKITFYFKLLLLLD